MKHNISTKISAVLFILFALFVLKLVVDAVTYNMQYRSPTMYQGGDYDKCVVGQPDC